MSCDPPGPHFGGSIMETKPPVPPFTPETATQKVRMAEDAWNTRDPDRVVLVYTEDTRWRNRAEFPVGREQVRQFLARKWARELDYRLIKELWACAGNRIAVRFAYECRDDSGNWSRSFMGDDRIERACRGVMEATGIRRARAGCARRHRSWLASPGRRRSR
jgi:nuclear transport factor 2 (NTF2) superfamily protein